MSAVLEISLSSDVPDVRNRIESDFAAFFAECTEYNQYGEVNNGYTAKSVQYNGFKLTISSGDGDFYRGYVTSCPDHVLDAFECNQNIGGERSLPHFGSIQDLELLNIDWTASNGFDCGDCYDICLTQLGRRQLDSARTFKTRHYVLAKLKETVDKLCEIAAERLAPDANMNQEYDSDVDMQEYDQHMAQ